MFKVFCAGIVAGVLASGLAFAETVSISGNSETQVEALRRGGSERKFEITLTNLSANIILTPPVFAVGEDQVKIFKLGQQASDELEALAEGGDTSGLTAIYQANGATVVQHGGPVLPGESVTVNVQARRRAKVHMASMLLPTNDAFVALNGESVRRRGTSVFNLKVYDAGTEDNDELAANIPGPITGGIGVSEDSNDGTYVTAHPGIHGEGDLSVKTYNWGKPVARVTVKQS